MDAGRYAIADEELVDRSISNPEGFIATLLAGSSLRAIRDENRRLTLFQGTR